MNWLHKDERGVTLLELVVALPIAAMIVIAASGAIFQMLNSVSARNHMVSYREVQTAGYWVSQDALQARIVDDNGGAHPGFPLTLSWTDWGDDEYSIIYTLEPMPSGNLKYVKRQEKVNGTETGERIVVGRYIYGDATPGEPTNCVWDEDEKVLTFTVRAEMGLETATRTYEVKPRPLA